MATETLENLRTRVRQRADMVYSKFVSDSELNSYINESAKDLYDLLVGSNEDYYTILSNITVTGGTYSLPSDFYKLRGLDWSGDGGQNWCRVKRFNFLERDKYNGPRSDFLRAPVMYQIVGNSLRFMPEEQAPGSYRLWYIPTLTSMSANSDTLEGVNGWEEYVVIDAAIKCLAKEESDTRALMQAKNEIFERVSQLSAERDYDGPDQIADVTREREYCDDY